MQLSKDKTKKLNLSKGSKESEQEESKSKPQPKPKEEPKKPKSYPTGPLNLFGDEGEEDDSDDEIIQESIQAKSNNSDKNIKYIIAGVAVLLVVVVLFIIILSGKKKDVEDTPNQEQPQTSSSAISSDVEAEPEIPDDPNLGTQNFLKDTNNKADVDLTNPDDFTKDLYGLTLRVDYNVSKIQDASDFVNYTKRRGTWGGGLELYYLDVVYKGSKYVIQVPFKYYKELDETGIVPVKMEVLRIESETDGTYLSVVSYMCLDEKTLQSVLKTQVKK